MDERRRQRINEVMSALQRELSMVMQHGEDGNAVKLKISSSPDHAKRLKILSDELRSLTGG